MAGDIHNTFRRDGCISTIIKKTCKSVIQGLFKMVATGEIHATYNKSSGVVCWDIHPHSVLSFIFLHNADRGRVTYIIEGAMWMLITFYLSSF